MDRAELECRQPVWVDGLSKQCGDLESWSNRFKNGFFMQLGFFLLSASLRLAPEPCQGDQGCRQSSSFSALAGMEANTLFLEAHLAVPAPSSRRWQGLPNGFGMGTQGILGINMQKCRAQCVWVAKGWSVGSFKVFSASRGWLIQT